MQRNLTSDQSLSDLRQLAEKARWRGDECLAVILAGIELYISLGRELELLETMREFEADIRPAVEGTPTAAELERLYRDEADAANGS
jgi:hypothetical protein